MQPQNKNSEWTVVEVDLLGPFPISGSEKFLLSVVDTEHLLLSLHVLDTVTQETLTQAILKHCFLHRFPSVMVLKTKNVNCCIEDSLLQKVQELQKHFGNIFTSCKEPVGNHKECQCVRNIFPHICYKECWTEREANELRDVACTKNGQFIMEILKDTPKGPQDELLHSRLKVFLSCLVVCFPDTWVDFVPILSYCFQYLLKFPCSAVSETKNIVNTHSSASESRTSMAKNIEFVNSTVECPDNTEVVDTLLCKESSRKSEELSSENVYLTMIPSPKKTSENRCSLCDKTFSTAKGTRQHYMLMHHKKNDFQCTSCKKTFEDKKMYSKHLLTHEHTLFRCTSCSYETDIKNSYLLHKKVHEKSALECKTCRKYFLSKESLEKHKELHKVSKPPYLCDSCGLQFSSSGSLRNHIQRIHREPLQLPCTLCDYVAKMKSDLILHVGRCHQKPYSCNLCSYASKSEDAVKRHREMYHNEKRRFPCPVCSYRGAHSKQLTEHMKSRHTSLAAQFSCNYCDGKFKTARMLKDHLPSHTGDKPYSCKICPYRCKYRPTLHRHSRVHHPHISSKVVVQGFKDAPEPSEDVKNTDVKLMLNKDSTNEVISKTYELDAKPVKVMLLTVEVSPVCSSS